jgi:UDP-N-acetylmuramate--alanine ligase
MDIYPAGEKPLPGVNSELLYRGIKETNVDVEYVEDREQVQSCLDMELKEGDILLTLGAGDVWKEGEEFIRPKNSE